MKQDQWQRPYTSKRYLQPPFSGYIHTQWPDFKILCSEVETTSANGLGFSAYRSGAYRILCGEEMEAPDYRRTKMLTREDGVPIHVMTYDAGMYSMRLESFCDTQGPKTCSFSKLWVRNETREEQVIRFAVLPRTGREDYLTGMNVDGYNHYNNNVGNWGFFRPKWVWSGDSLRDPYYALDIGSADGFRLKWVESEHGRFWYQRYALELTAVLQPGGEASITLRLHPHKYEDASFDYAAERAATEEFWKAQLGKLRRIPDAPQYEGLTHNLVAQLLQHIAWYTDRNCPVPRQGGLNRFVWSAEAMEWLKALDLLGGYSEYTRAAVEFFFDHSQNKSGSDRGEVVLTSGWGGTTGCAINAGAFHILHTGADSYEHFAQPLYEAFRWIERQRLTTKDSDLPGKGIFPPCRGTDWDGNYQNWCITDGYNLMGYKQLLEAFTHYKDPRAGEIQEAYEDYLACMRLILREEVEKNPLENEILLPNRLGKAMIDPPLGPYFIDGPVMLIMSGVTEPDSQVTRLVENFFRNRRCMYRGFTGLMTDGHLPWLGHTWYMSMSDAYWFRIWMAQGRRDKAEETLRANLQYGMSDAFCLVERFADNDPYFAPWQPNASANGRMLQMLGQFYGYRDI